MLEFEKMAFDGVLESPQKDKKKLGFVAIWSFGAHLRLFLVEKVIFTHAV